METTSKASKAGRQFVALLSASATLAIATFVSASTSTQVKNLEPLVVSRTAHVATVLADGHILMTGGRDSAGNIVAVTEIFDPATETSTDSATLNTPRVNHTATRLGDGRILVAGGSDGTAPLSSAEIFDPANPDAGFRALSATMFAARTGHTATVLNNGAVLIAGGEADGTAEIFDPTNETFSPTLWAMTQPRSGHTATLLTDDSVLLAGGNSDTIEHFTPADQTFTLETAHMSFARAGHWALELSDTRLLFFEGDTGNTIDEYNPVTGTVTLKDTLDVHGSSTTLLANGKVLVLGSDVAGLYDANAVPPTSPFTAFDETSVPGSSILPRTGQTATELSGHKSIFIAGGVNADNEFVNPALFNPARIWTDRDDYLPDEPVILSGSGWKTSEDIYLYAVDNETQQWTYESTVPADANGEFVVDPYFIVELRHAGVQFHVTALGAQSTMQADVYFTDSNPQTITVGTQSPNPVVAGNTATYLVTVHFGGNNQSPCDVTLSLAAPTPAGVVSATFSPNPVTGTGGGGGGQDVTSTLTISTSASMTPNPSPSPLYTFTVHGTNAQTGCQGNGPADGTGTLRVAGATATTTTVTSSANPSTYGNSVTFTATVASTSTPTGSVNFTIAGIGIVAGTPGATTSTTATWTYTTSALTVAGSPHAVSANYVHTGSFADSSGSLSGGQTVNKATPTATLAVNNSPQTYNGSGQSATVAISVSSVPGTVTNILTGGAASQTNAGTYAVTANFVPNDTANYNTLTAQSAGNFTIDKKAASVTPNAASKTYGDADPALTGTLSGFLAGDGVTATYSRTAGETVAGSPYTISATLSPAGVLGNYDITYNTANFTIDQKAASVTPNAASKTYGDVDPAFTGTLTGFLGADGVTATYSRTAGETVAGSPYTISATLSPVGVLDNYNITYNTAEFTINKRDASVTPNAASKTYGDADPALTGTLTGFLGADGVTATYSRTVGETVAGSPYTISAVLSPAGVLGNYDITYNTADFTIDKKAASVTPNAASKTYGDVDPAFTGTLTGFLGADGVTATYSRTVGETVAGSPYTISATLSPAGVLGNYDITYNTADFTIDKKTASVTPNAASKTYGDVDPAFTGTLTGFLGADGVTATYSRTAGETVAGSPYTISATLSPADVLDNYNITYNTANFTIDQKAASVTPNAASKTYGDADPALTGTLTGFLGGDGVTATYSRTTGETVADGPYTISATLSPADVLDNYNITYNTANFTITPKDASVTPNAASKTYGDADPALTGTLTGFLGGDGVTATYSRTTGETVADGPYTISATLSPADVLDNYNITYNTANFTITPKDASVTPNAASKTYGDADPALTGTLTGFLGGDGVTATYSRTAGETVADGPYTISATLSPADVLGNYNITYNTANFTINPRPATVTADDKAKTYGDANPGLTATVTGTVNGDVLDYTLATTALQFSSVGNYPITVTLGSNPNYDVTPADGTLAISARPATVTADDKAKTYGDANPVLTATVTGTVNGDVLNYTLATIAVQFSGVGDYPITVTLGSNPNYDVTPADGTLTISARPATVTADDKAKTYGDANPVLTATVTGTVNGDTLNYSLSTTATQCSNVGPYAITVTLGSNPNYNVTPTNGTLTITKAHLTVRADDKSKAYDGNPFTAFTVTITGFSCGDTVAVVSGSAGYTGTAVGATLPGTYIITPTVGTLNATNYDFTPFVNGTLTIGYGTCSGTPGGVILPPINSDGSSVYKRKAGSTIPVKFRVCDANGNPISDPAAVFAGTGGQLTMTGRIRGTVDNVNEVGINDIPDVAFTYTGGQWHFNMATTNLEAGYTYTFRINLAYGSIIFQIALK